MLRVRSSLFFALHSTPHTTNILTIRKKHGCRVSKEPTPTLHPYIQLIQSVLRPSGVECRLLLSWLHSAKSKGNIARRMPYPIT